MPIARDIAVPAPSVIYVEHVDVWLVSWNGASHRRLVAACSVRESVVVKHKHDIPVNLKALTDTSAVRKQASAFETYVTAYSLVLRMVCPKVAHVPVVGINFSHNSKFKGLIISRPRRYVVFLANRFHTAPRNTCRPLDRTGAEQPPIPP